MNLLDILNQHLPLIYSNLFIITLIGSISVLIAGLVCMLSRWDDTTILGRKLVTGSYGVLLITLGIDCLTIISMKPDLIIVLFVSLMIAYGGYHIGMLVYRKEWMKE